MNKVGVIGAGSFGTSIAVLLSSSSQVYLYTRNPDTANAINNAHRHLDVELDHKIFATTNIEEVTKTCDVIFPIVPSANFRDLMKAMYPYLGPQHMLIHGTKGLDVTNISKDDLSMPSLSRDNVHTMSEVIKQETTVRRIGCLSGPNLAKEILQGQPTATVIASEFDEVINKGKELLSSNRFFVFASHDVLGAELAGALKNIMALGSGIVTGYGLGKNVQAMLLTRGLREMISFGKAMGATSRSFIGTSGMGDLIATATSDKSRNFKLGFAMGSGKTLEEGLEEMHEVAEGVRTLKIARRLAQHFSIKVPITEMLHRVVFEDFPLDKAISQLMRYPFMPDVDFL